MGVIVVKTLKEFADVNKVKVIIDFYATWCGPCKVISPKFEEYSEKFTNLKFVKIDVDNSPELAKKFEIQAMPTFKVVENGNVVDELVGANPAKLLQLIEKHDKK